MGEKRQTIFLCGKRIGADSHLQGIQRGGRLGLAGGLLAPFELTAQARASCIHTGRWILIARTAPGTVTREVPAVAFRAVKMVVKSVTSDHEQSAVRRTNAVTHRQLVVHREEPNAISLGFLGLCSIGVDVEVPSGSRLALHFGAGHRHEAEGSQRSSVIRTSVGGLAAVADFFHAFML